MTESPFNLPTIPGSEAPPVRAGRWWFALLLAAAVSAILNMLMARIIWLPLYSGLFGFLVEGLLIGGLAFRIARPLRPVPARRRWSAVILLSLWCGATFLFWEYRYTRATIAEGSLFHNAKNQALQKGTPPSHVNRLAAEAFDRRLARDYYPGSAIGYALWSFTSGAMSLEVAGETETVSTPHTGWPWLLRSLGGLILVAAGLWFSLDALRSPQPVSNVIAPGEEYEEIE